MSREIFWTTDAAKDLNYWKKNNITVARRIAVLVESICENPFIGIGKPEPLRFSLSGCWSRRINQEHRLVYRMEKDRITIISCRFHYDVK